MGQRVDIGADEVFSCDDDLTEDDVYHPVDWTADGIINFHEYGIFAAAWLSVDPNNPLCDPNNPNYVSDPNDPDYISEDDKLRYRPRCDLDTDLDVDLADLALFCDEWLWMACWKEAQLYRFDMMMAMGGGERMSMSVGDGSPESVMQENETSLQEAVASYVFGVYGVLEYLDAQIERAPPNLDVLYDIRAFLIECLEEAKASVAH